MSRRRPLEACPPSPRKPMTKGTITAVVYSSNASWNCTSNLGETSAGPDATTNSSASRNGRPSANTRPAAATHTDRLIPAEQQTSTHTLARNMVATDSAASRRSQFGLSPPSDSGNRHWTRSRGRTACCSLSASECRHPSNRPIWSFAREWRAFCGFWSAKLFLSQKTPSEYP